MVHHQKNVLKAQTLIKSKSLLLYCSISLQSVLINRFPGNDSPITSSIYQNMSATSSAPAITHTTGGVPLLSKQTKSNMYEYEPKTLERV